MLIYTVCNLKTLKNAIVLGDSVKKFHPESEFVIGLVDKKNEISTEFQKVFEITEIDEIGIDFNENSWSEYTCEEFLRNSKPFFCKFFLEKFTLQNKIIFISPTSKIYQPLSFIEENLEENSIILVPQLLNALHHPDEKQALNSGIFHAGLYALKKDEESLKFLDWWSENTSNKGFINLEKGMNAEQLWLELVPTIFEKVYIEKNHGLNIGKWNLPERNIKYGDNQYFAYNFPVVSFDFEGLKHWSDYSQDLKKYKNIDFDSKIPHFGIYAKPTSKIKRKMKLFLVNIINQIDKFFDKF